MSLQTRCDSCWQYLLVVTITSLQPTPHTQAAVNWSAQAAVCCTPCSTVLLQQSGHRAVVQLRQGSCFIVILWSSGAVEVPALSALHTTVPVQIWNTMLCGHQGLATVTCLTDSSGHMHTSWGCRGAAHVWLKSGTLPILPLLCDAAPREDIE